MAAAYAARGCFPLVGLSTSVPMLVFMRGVSSWASFYLLVVCSGGPSVPAPVPVTVVAADYVEFVAILYIFFSICFKCSYVHSYWSWAASTSFGLNGVLNYFLIY